MLLFVLSSWVASDFIRLTLDLFAYERDADSALVLAAGLLPQWLEGEGVVVENLRTPYGHLSYSLHRQGRRLMLQVEPACSRRPVAWCSSGPARSRLVPLA